MNIEEINANPDLVRKLNSLHRSLTSSLKDSVDYDKFSYRQDEINMTLDYKVVNQHIAENRLNKIKALSDLSENWDAFKTLYKDDLILKKIGVEFLEGKFEFNKEILDTIKAYPHKQEVLFYFKKGVDVNLGDVVAEDYAKFKQQILPSIQEESLVHLQQKNDLVKALRSVMEDKSQKNLNYIGGLTEQIGSIARINVEYGQVIPEILSRVKTGDFVARQDENNMIVELPLPGIKKDGDKDVKTSAILMKINLENPKEYSIEVDSFKSLTSNIHDKINSIREKALEVKVKLKTPKMA